MLQGSGYAVAVRVCPRCRSVYSVDVKFCGIDGEPLEQTASDPLIGRRVDRYEIIDRLGAGGMGCVYRARHIHLDRRFALKVLFGEMAADEKLSERFRREARSASALEHPNVVGVTDFGTSAEGLNFLVMEYVVGTTLGAAMRKEGPFSVERAADLCRQIACGLEVAHDHGFVHRDLKPGNVMLDERGDGDLAKILDFGLVSIIDEEDVASKLTKTGWTVGTPMYMAPEQADGGAVGPAADLYSLGVILYEMLAGNCPFHDEVGSSPSAVMIAKMTKTPTPLSPAGGLERIAMALLERDPAQRPRSATVVLEAVDALGLSLPSIGARPSTPAPRPEAAGGAARSNRSEQVELPSEDPMAPSTDSSEAPTTHPPGRSRARPLVLAGLVAAATLTAALAVRRHAPSSEEPVVEAAPRGANARSVGPQDDDRSDETNAPATATESDGPQGAAEAPAEQPKAAVPKKEKVRRTRAPSPSVSAAAKRSDPPPNPVPTPPATAAGTPPPKAEPAPAPVRSAYERVRAKLEDVRGKLSASASELNAEQQIAFGDRLEEIDWQAVEGLGDDAYGRLAKRLAEVEREIAGAAR